LKATVALLEESAAGSGEISFKLPRRWGSSSWQEVFVSDAEAADCIITAARKGSDLVLHL